MSGSSTMGGGLLKYKILIEAADMASGRLQKVKELMRQVQQFSGKGFQMHRPHMDGVIHGYQDMAKVADKYSFAVMRTISAQGKLGKSMADSMMTQRREAYAGMYDIEKMYNLAQAKWTGKGAHVGKEMGFMYGIARKMQEAMFQPFAKKHGITDPLYGLDSAGRPMKPAEQAFPSVITGYGISSRPTSAHHYDQKTQERIEISKQLDNIYKAPDQLMAKLQDASLKATTGQDFMQRASAIVSAATKDLPAGVGKGIMEEVAARYSIGGKPIAGMSQQDLQQVGKVIQDPHMKTHADLVKEAADGYGIWSQRLTDFKIRAQGIATLLFNFSKNLKAVLETTRQLASAQVFSGGRFGWGGVLSQTAMGVTAQDTGLLWQGIARSPYQQDLLSAAPGILAYSKIFGKQTEQFLPTLSGLHAVFDDQNISMNQRMMMMLGTSAKSSLDFAQWFSRFMQGGVPAMESTGMGMGQTLGIIGALSNVGLGPYASFGMAEVVNAMSKPSKASSEWQRKMGLDLGDIMANEGLIVALERTRKALDELSTEDKLKAVHEIFGGRSTGVAQVMMKTTDHAKELAVQLNSVYESHRIMLEEMKQGLRILDQTSAAWNNLSTGFARYYTQRHIFRGFAATAREIPEMINPWLEQAQGSHRSVAGEVITGLPMLGIAAYAPFLAKSIVQSFTNVGMYSQLLQGRMLGAPDMIASMKNAGFTQEQINKQQKGHYAWSGRMGKIGSGLSTGLMVATAVASLYTVIKSIDNAVYSIKKDIEKEKYFDPIADLSIADFRPTDEEGRMELARALDKATAAIHRNSTMVDKNTRSFDVKLPYQTQQGARRHLDMMYGVIGGQ